MKGTLCHNVREEGPIRAQAAKAPSRSPHRAWGVRVGGPPYGRGASCRAQIQTRFGLLESRAQREGPAARAWRGTVRDRPGGQVFWKRHAERRLSSCAPIISPERGQQRRVVTVVVVVVGLVRSAYILSELFIVSSVLMFVSIVRVCVLHGWRLGGAGGGAPHRRWVRVNGL